jgi:hypothetical protein
VACVECHIGPVAGWFLRSKVSGMRQVVGVTFHTYSRPIPSPVKCSQPAHETCEPCHGPQRSIGDKLAVNTSYKDDEKNTPQTDGFRLKAGGRTWQGSVAIHGHHLADGTDTLYRDGPRASDNTGYVRYGRERENHPSMHDTLGIDLKIVPPRFDVYNGDMLISKGEKVKGDKVKGDNVKGECKWSGCEAEYVKVAHSSYRAARNRTCRNQPSTLTFW